MLLRKNYVFKLAASGLLIAIGIVIPMFSPLKIVLEPASFTLASHVAIFIAMFISPSVAVAVAAGTSLGFLLGGFPLVIVLRAASHVVFAFCGAMYFSKVTDISAARLRVCSLLIGVVHAICELIVVSVFYFGGDMPEGYYGQGFVMSVLLLVGLGTVVHSMVDFEIANAIMLVVKKSRK